MSSICKKCYIFLHLWLEYINTYNSNLGEDKKSLIISKFYFHSNARAILLSNIPWQACLPKSFPALHVRLLFQQNRPRTSCLDSFCQNKHFWYFPFGLKTSAILFLRNNYCTLIGMMNPEAM